MPSDPAYVCPCLQAAKDVVLANKPIITDDSATLEPALLKTLMEQISTLASVYHKPADTFVSRQRLAVQTVESVASRTFEEEEATGAAAAAQVGTHAGSYAGWTLPDCRQWNPAPLKCMDSLKLP